MLFSATHPESVSQRLPVEARQATASGQATEKSSQEVSSAFLLKPTSLYWTMFERKSRVCVCVCVLSETCDFRGGGGGGGGERNRSILLSLRLICLRLQKQLTTWSGFLGFFFYSECPLQIHDLINSMCAFGLGVSCNWRRVRLISQCVMAQLLTACVTCWCCYFRRDVFTLARCGKRCGNVRWDLMLWV